MADEKIDGLFMTGLQSVNGIEPFFECLFSFLRRKTDFYTSPTSFNAIKLAHERSQKKYEEQKEKELKKKQKLEEEKRKLELEQQQNKPSEKGDPTIKEITPEEFERRKKLEQDIANKIQTEKNDEKNDEKKDDEKGEGKEKEEYKGLKPINNGSKTDTYSWTQPVITELIVQLPIDEKVRGKDVTVKYTSKNVFIQVKGAEKPLIDGEWCKPIQADSFMWRIEESFGKKFIEINIEKLDKMSWWDCLVKGEPTIDTSKISPESSKIDELDPEMQQTVKKMMYDQQMKQMGKPTSDEQKKFDMLEKFKKAHPEMDFSNAKFS